MCEECKTTSMRPGVCQIEDCTSNGVALKECNCEDGMHQGLLSKNTDSSSEESDASEHRTSSGTTMIDLDSEDTSI